MHSQRSKNSSRSKKETESEKRKIKEMKEEDEEDEPRHLVKEPVTLSKKSLFKDHSSRKKLASENSQELEPIEETDGSAQKPSKEKSKKKKEMSEAIETKNLLPDYNQIVNTQDSPFFGEKQQTIVDI